MLNSCAALVLVVGNNPGRGCAVQRGIPKPHHSSADRWDLHPRKVARKVAEGCRAGVGEASPGSIDTRVW